MYAHLLGRIAELERQVSMMMVPATVHQRDHAKGVRFKYHDGESGQPVLSSWVKPPDKNKGTRSAWLPQVGSQHVVLTAPGSDQASTFVPMGHHDASPNPASDADDTVLYDDGTCRIAVKGGKITLKSGSSEITIEGSKIEVHSSLVKASGDHLKHNSKNIGDDHKHEDVEPGGGLSGPPIA
jgi:phage baseplate assembly protein gpV